MWVVFLFVILGIVGYRVLQGQSFGDILSAQGFMSLVFNLFLLVFFWRHAKSIARYYITWDDSSIDFCSPYMKQGVKVLDTEICRVDSGPVRYILHLMDGRQLPLSVWYLRKKDRRLLDQRLEAYLLRS